AGQFLLLRRRKATRATEPKKNSETVLGSGVALLTVTPSRPQFTSSPRWAPVVSVKTKVVDAEVAVKMSVGPFSQNTLVKTLSASAPSRLTPSKACTVMLCGWFGVLPSRLTK